MPLAVRILHLLKHNPLPQIASHPVPPKEASLRPPTGVHYYQLATLSYPIILAHSTNVPKPPQGTLSSWYPHVPPALLWYNDHSVIHHLTILASPYHFPVAGQGPRSHNDTLPFSFTGIPLTQLSSLKFRQPLHNLGYQLSALQQNFSHTPNQHENHIGTFPTMFSLNLPQH